MIKTNTKKTFRYYFKAARNHVALGLVMFGSIIAARVIDLITPLYLRDFFNVLSGSSPTEAVVKTLIDILIIISVLKFVEWLIWRVANHADSTFTSRVAFDLGNMCFAYLHKHSFAYFNNNFVGSMVKRVKWFVKAFETITDRFAWSLFPLFVDIAVISGVLFYTNFWLGFGVFAWTVLFLAINWAFTKYKLKYDIARSEAETVTTRVLADTITNSANVKLFNGYQREVKLFSQVLKDFTDKRLWAWTLGNIIEAVQGFLMTILEVGIMFLAVWLWQQGKITIGDFILIQTYLISIFMRTWEFGRVVRTIYENLADAEEMTVVLETPHEIIDVPGAKKIKINRGEIKFQNVSFNYHETRKLLVKLNLTVAPGERLALVGPSGAGKTTITKLLLRMHDLTGGVITIDGQDISKVTQESLWANVSLVPQEPVLFHRTLMENIRYGKPNATDKEVMASAKAANCHDFITRFPDGYNTYVGERGVKLSGGERQRVAIARAILRNAPILVLDEATSSLDSASERLIQEALDKLMKDKTVIVIAHRLSTIRKMDRVIVMDRKGIVEEGTHDELTAKKDGLYQKLWQLQAGGFI
ncbi:MAG: ABC transporter ATP-binding protein [Candidatus Buchananbacteria bacterium]|nr:ABC transporter ATP-binding protein [Candidatus Buchananbacteria bacterium]